MNKPRIKSDSQLTEAIKIIAKEVLGCDKIKETGSGVGLGLRDISYTISPGKDYSEYFSMKSLNRLEHLVKIKAIELGFRRKSDLVLSFNVTKGKFSFQLSGCYPGYNPE